MGEEDGVDVFEDTGADVVGFGAELLFADAGPEFDGSGGAFRAP